MPHLNILPDRRQTRLELGQLQRGTKAPQAAGKVHTDTERFYETIAWVNRMWWQPRQSP